MKKILLIALIAVFTVSLLGFAFGCNATTAAETTAAAETKAAETTAAANDEIVAGYAVMGLTDEYWNTQILGMKKAIKESGKNIRFEVADNKYDNQQTLDNVDNLISRGVKYLIVSVLDQNLGPVILEKAAAAGVTVIASDVPIEGTYYMAIENFQAGQIAGEYAGNYFLKNFADQKAKVAYLTQAASSSVVTPRCDGFKDAFSKLVPDSVHLDLQDVEGQREKAVTVTNDILTANPDVNVIFGINDESAIGAASVVEARELVGKIITFGQGGIGENAFATLTDPNSPFKATTAYMPDGHGAEIITKFVLPLAEGKEVDDTIYSSLLLVDSSNAQKMLDDLKALKAEYGQ